MGGHAQIGLAVFVGSLPLNGRIVSVVSFLAVILIAIAGMILNMVISHWPYELIAFPPFAFCRAASLILKYGGDVLVWGSERTNCLLALLVEGTILCILGLIIMNSNALGYGKFARIELCPRKAVGTSHPNGGAGTMNSTSDSQASRVNVTPAPIDDVIEDPEV